MQIIDLFFLIIESADNCIIFNDIDIYFETKKKTKNAHGTFFVQNLYYINLKHIIKTSKLLFELKTDSINHNCFKII